MLHATLFVDEILGMFQVRCVLTEFTAGQDPTIWESANESLTLPEEMAGEDALYTLLEILRLWSERTIQQ